MFQHYLIHCSKQINIVSIFYKQYIVFMVVYFGLVLYLIIDPHLIVFAIFLCDFEGGGGSMQYILQYCVCLQLSIYTTVI